jgi:hypothetical protein
MTWEGRLKEAAYTSPSGTRIRFTYEDVGRETEKRTAAFQFPGVDGAYVQDNGSGARKYPLSCIFWGSDHDREATVFEAALLERGVGRLEHPMYGTFDVVPFGAVTRRDDLASSANQTIITVTFWTTTGIIYPQSRPNPRSEILASLDAFDAAAAGQFADSMDLSTTAARASAAATTRSFLGDVRAALGSAAEATADVRREFAAAEQAINVGLDVLIGDPLQLARQAINLVRAPAVAAAGIRSRLDGYAALAERIFFSPAGRPGDAFTSGVVLPGRRRLVANDFFTADLFGMAAATGSVLSVVESEFDSRPRAIAAADAVLGQFDDTVAWRDGGYGDLGEVDSGAAYQAAQQAVALAAGFLVEVSFSLVPERAIVLSRPRTIVDLAAELYGEVDQRLDFLIATNGLTGDEILELPRGRRVVFYA